jgi:hypothetical protein
MKVICAWCRREGWPGLLGERDPLDDPTETHGICGRHLRQTLADLPSASFPDTSLLLVVRPDEPTLYEYLRQGFLGVSGVTVIMDRRRGERRRESRTVPQERRRAERRQRRGEISALGYMLVRFRPGAAPRA